MIAHLMYVHIITMPALTRGFRHRNFLSVVTLCSLLLQCCVHISPVTALEYELRSFSQCENLYDFRDGL